MKPQVNVGKILAIGAALAAVMAVSTSIWLDPPAENRARAMDKQRLVRLSNIESALSTYFNAHQALPADLKALHAEKNQLSFESWHDPETGSPFEYEITGEKNYRLCANFERTSDGQAPHNYYFRKHGAGRDCFENQVKPK